MNMPGPEKILQESLIKIKELKKELDTIQHGAIAIIGLNCHFPGGANTAEQFWRCLSQDYDASRELGSARWDHANFYSADRHQKGKIYTQRAALLDTAIEKFDAGFFGISTEEALLLDPQQRLLLETTWEAIENSGINPATLRDSLTGVFVGICSSDYKDLLVKQASPESMEGYVVTGNIPSTASGRIAYTFGLKGPTLSLDTACSSSLAAVHQACQALRLGECDLAIAAGVHLILSPEAMALECSMQMLSLQGMCRTFDKDADGFMRGEGCGVVVLKPLNKAIQEGDPIMAVIKGSAITHCGTSGGLTIPNGKAQEDVIMQALQQAQLCPDDIDYIEAHGTATGIGDSIEMKALYHVFGAQKNNNKRVEPLIIGTVKTNIGHTEAVSGIAGLIKTVLSLQNEQIPKHLHFKSLHPGIKDMEKIPAQLPLQAMPWKKVEDRKRKAGISAFGFNGTNVHMVIEEHTEPLNRAISSVEEELLNNKIHLLRISAKTDQALQEQIALHLEYLNETTEKIADICYTSQEGRSHFNKCVYITGNTKFELIEKLNKKSYVTEQELQKLDYTYSSEIKCYLKKVLLPHYPFQGETCWPKTIYLPQYDSLQQHGSDFIRELQALSKEERADYLYTRLVVEIHQALNMPLAQEIEKNLGFFDMGMSSLAALSFKDRLESMLGKSVEETAVFEYSTLSKLSEYCQELLSDTLEFTTKKINEASQSINSSTEIKETIYNMNKEDLYASLYAELSVNEEKKMQSAHNHFQSVDAKLMVCLKKEGEKQPLFCVPGVDGHPEVFLDLVERLDINRPIYAIRAPELIEADTRFTSLIDRASTYCGFIQQVQSQGPYHLAGWSMGGIVAIEMSNQLINRHEEMAFLGTIDSYVNNKNDTISLEYHDVATFYLQILNEQLGNDPVAVKLESSQMVLNEIKNTLCKFGLPTVTQEKINNDINVIANALREFLQHSFQGSATNAFAFNAKEPSMLFSKKEGHFLSNSIKLTADNIQSVIVDGNHFSLLKKENNAGLAECLIKLIG